METTSFFSQAQVVYLFSQWRPSNVIDDDVKSLIADFMTTRGRDFSKNVIAGIRSKQVKVALHIVNF